MGLRELVPAGKLFLTDRNLFQERENRTEDFRRGNSRGLKFIAIKYLPHVAIRTIWMPEMFIRTVTPISKALCLSYKTWDFNKVHYYY